MSCVGTWASSFGSNFTNNVMSNFTTPGGGVGAGATAAINGTNALMQSAAGLTRLTHVVQAVRGIEGGVIGGVAGGGSTAAWIGAAAGTAAGIALIPFVSATAIGAIASTAGAILAGAAAQAAYQTFSDQGMPGAGCPGDQNGDGFPDGQEPPPGTPPAGGDGTGGYGGMGGPAGGGSPWGMGGNPLRPPPRDPLVLDLDRDGLELISVAQSQVNFDLDANGFAERTGWVAPDDGFLVRDLNANGVVDGVSELFGNANQDGFDALTQVDSNSDGRIDAQDAIWSQLRVWVDADSDGQTDAGELRTLAQLGIDELPVSSIVSTRLVAGNAIGREGTYVLEDGQTGGMFSAYFAVNTQLTQWTPPAGFTLSALGDKTPPLKGFGNVADLAVAVTNNTALATVVETFLFASQAMDGATLRQGFEALLFKWAGVDGVAAGSRGAHVDAKHLAVLEAFYGTSYLQGGGATNPDAGNGRVLEATYRELLDSYLTQFMSGAAVGRMLVSGDADHFEDPDILYAALTQNAFTGWMMGDPETTLQALALTRPDSTAQWAQYFDRVLTVTAGVRLDFYGGDAAAYKSAWSAALTPLNDAALNSLVSARVAATGMTFGGGGGETVAGGAAADILVGGAGNDRLAGGDGDDSYVWARGDGSDTITEGTNAGSQDKLLLLGVDPADVTLSRSGGDVTLTVAPSAAGGDGGSIKLLANLDEYFSQGVEQVVFADGTIWTRADLRLKLLAQGSTSGADTVTGFNTADTITAAAGDDRLNGADGSDVFVWARGHGSDTITESTNSGSLDKLVLQGIAPADVTLARSGNDVTLIVSGTDGGSIKLIANLDDYFDQGVDRIAFDDGTTWTRGDLRLRLLAEASTSGADTVAGFNTADTITAAAGDDKLNGADGSDVFIWARGHGSDTITESTNSGSLDKLVLQGVAPADVTLSRSGNDVTLTVAGTDGGSIKLIANLDDYFDQGVDRIAFDDGTTWTRADLRLKLLAQASTSGADTVTGFNTADTITAAAGDDRLNGADGNDVFIWARGHGSDTITESTNSGSLDKLVLQGVNPADVTLSRSGNDVTLTVAGPDGGSIKLIANLDDYFDQGVDRIAFDDGTIWTRADLRSKLITVGGTAGADTLTGTNVNDLMSGGGGNDALNGAGGSDTYLWARGDGSDTITESTNAGTLDKLVLQGVSPADVTLVRSGNNVTLTVAGTDGGSIRLVANLDDYFSQGVEQIAFDDGTIWTRADLRLRLLAEASTSGADTVTGFNTADTITAAAGDDRLNGADGSDVFVWARGHGSDTITESTNSGSLDNLVLQDVNPTDVTLTRSGNDVTLTVAGTDGGSIKLIANLDDYFDQGVDRITFGDGTVWTRADLRLKLLAQGSTSGADTITGFNTADTITAAAGDDRLNGADGSDTFIWARGHGSDTITESTNSGSLDKLVLQGVNPADVTLSRSGNDVTLIVSGTDGGSIKLIANLDDYFDQGVDRIAFDDGTTWTRGDLRLKLLAQGSTSGADTLTGFNTADTITAAAGDDRLNGADGSDVFIWARGHGSDTITESTNSGSLDKLVLQGVAPADVTLARSGNDVTLTVAGTDGGSIKLIANLDDYFDQGVDRIAFDDGTTWTRGDLRLKLLAQGSTSGADTITGFNTADTITGAAGDDRLNGADGSDTFIWARGHGSDTITESTNSGSLDKLVLQGIAPADVALARSGNDVTLTVSGTDGGSIKLVANLDDYFDQGVDRINFDDGTIWTRADLRSKLLAQASTSGNDAITGFSSADTITGGAGADTLTGGSGADVFRFEAEGDSPAGSGFDRITDFASGDKINLSAIDANSAVAGDQAFAWIGSAAFSGVAGQLRVDPTPSGSRTVYGDVNGDSVADFQLLLTGTGTLQSSDFVL